LLAWALAVTAVAPAWPGVGELSAHLPTQLPKPPLVHQGKSSTEM
jgi:hypothetical protein